MASPPASFGLLLNADHSHTELARLAADADDAGLRTFWYADERFYRETYTGLAVAAMHTRRIRLGPAVTDPYTRHPALTAAAIASLDELSGRRAVLGLGAGISGFHNLGIAVDRPVTALRDGVTIVRGLLAGGPVDHEGRVHAARGARMLFPTRPEIPIYLAADGPRLLRLAGEIADGVITAHTASATLLRARIAEVDRGAALAHRARPEIVVRLDLCVADDPESAVAYAKVRLGRYLWARYPDIAYLDLHGIAMPAELERRLAAAGPFVRTHDLGVFRRFADAISDEMVRPIALAGSPRDVARQARELFACGAAEIMAMPLVPDGSSDGPVSMLGRVLDALRSELD